MTRRHVKVALVLGTLMVGVLSLSMTQSGGRSPAGAGLPVTPVQAVSTVGPELFADFESGHLQGWSSTAMATVTNASTAQGRYAGEVRANAAPGYLQWGPDLVHQGWTHASLRAYVQLVSRADGESVDLITIKNNNMVHNFDFFVTGDTQRFKWDLYRANSGESAFVVQRGRWYLVEIRCAFAGTSYSATVRIDGVSQPMIASSGQKPSTVKAVWLGTSVSKTHVQRYDEVSLRLTDS